MERTAVRSELSAALNDQLSDADIDRFLRARHHNIDKAVEMIKRWGAWWNEPLAGTTLTPADYQQYSDDPDESIYAKYMPHANLRYDKSGCPAYWEKTGLISASFHESKKHLTEDQMVIRHVRQQEMMVNRLKQSSVRHGRQIEQQVIIMDMDHLSYTLDLTALATFRRTLAIDEAFYPERLKTLIMINVPWFFAGMWAVIRPWVDPVTAAKFQILGRSYHSKLKELFHDDDIPVEYGGTRVFAWQAPNNLDGIDDTQSSMNNAAAIDVTTTSSSAAIDE